MRSSDRQLRASVLDINRSGRDLRTPDPIPHKLMRVTNFSLISGSYYRYLYWLREATMSGTSPYSPALSVNAAIYTGLSVSEMSNSATFDYVSYGVAKSNIPQGFVPKPIPINTIVMALPWWASDGTCIYMIVNTQAIDGTCGGGSGLTADDDYGALLMPSDLIFDGGEFESLGNDYDYGGITFDDFGQFYDPVNQNDQQTYANPVSFTIDYGTY